jgi:metallo-beta-lactamase class B
MHHCRRSFALPAALLLATAARAEVVPDPPIDCPNCVAWNQPQRPFKVFGNTYYVGTAELAAILIRTSDGLILLDAALPQSAPPIDASIAALGLKTAEIRLIVTSHAHYDHVGGVAALQRASRATVAASPSSADALRAGRPTPDDPQAAIPGNGFPRVANVRVIADGETLTVGDTAITARFTPGHTPGSTTWAWRACEGARCLNVVYADSLNAVSADAFRFSGSASVPSRVDAFRRSIRTVQELPCDLLLTPHADFFDLETRLRRLEAGDGDAFVDSTACRRYASAAAERLEQRIAAEAAATR